MENKKYISDIIGDEYKEWDKEKIILDCGTGRGKTTFVLSKLCIHAMENGKFVLYLCNRSKLKEQIEDEVSSRNLFNIKVMTYQKLQKDILNKTFENTYYDYIVADEVHYIFNDASFNLYTDITFDYLEAQTDNVVVFMSATAKSIFGYFCKQEIVKVERRYVLDSDYGHVDKVLFYERKAITDIIDEILAQSDDDKLLVFINSEKMMLKMHGLYNDIANYYCSEHSKELKSIREKDCIINYDQGHISFEKRILFTTTALDNGVDLKDEKIKYIISEIFEPDTAIQCLGRKRPVHSNDKCTFYIANYDKKTISLFSSKNEVVLKPLNLFKMDKENYIKEYGRKREFHCKYIYNDWDNYGIPKLNRAGHIKLVIQKVDLMGMNNHGYMNFILKWSMSHELASKVVSLILEPNNDIEFLEYLESIKDKLLDKQEQNLFKEKCKLVGFNSRSIGVKTIQSFLRENSYNYVLRSERKRIDGRQTTVWIVEGK